MTESRRYRDDEVREIFGLAARHPVAEPLRQREAEGLTLAEIQEIGHEVGLAPAAVAKAAAALDARALRARRRSALGMPVEVRRIVPLPRAPTDAEWEQLVADLRSTFGARGEVSSHGSLREWVNGNLHACVERTEAGHRLRLGTRKGDASALNAVGATGLVGGALAFAALLASGGVGDAVVVGTTLAGSGVAAFLANIVRLPRWADRRAGQMERIAARATELIRAEPEAPRNA